MSASYDASAHAADSDPVEPMAVASQAIAEYVAGSYECLAQIEMAKRRLAELKQQVSSALSPLAGGLDEKARIKLLADFYWDAKELPSEPVADGLSLRIQSVLQHIPPRGTDVPCRGCGDELFAKSRTQYLQMWAGVRDPHRHGWKLYCDACDRRRTASRKQEWDAREQAAQQAWRARQVELRAMPYSLYLRSQEWQKTRAAALKRARYRCQLCGVFQWVTLDVHHSTYERLGHELPADLIVLCRDCHTKHHTQLPEPDDGRRGAQS